MDQNRLISRLLRYSAQLLALLGLLSVLWGGSFFFNGLVLKELPPLTIDGLDACREMFGA